MGTTTRHVLVLYEESLLAQGLAALLRARPGLRVDSGRFHDVRPEELLETYEPDVIVVDRDDFTRHAGMTVDELLSKRPCMKVVALGTQDDMGLVYEGHQVRMARLDDLLATLSPKGGGRKRQT